MTDATAGRSGVGIRLFVMGGEVVRRTFDQIGDSGRKMWAQVALGERSSNPAIKALSISANEAKSNLQGLASRAGSVGVALGAFGPMGLAAAAGLGALTVAVAGAFSAMAGAAVLTDTAERIGVGVEALQQWRYVADEAGVDTAKFEAGMEKLNGTLGKFKLGIGDGRLKPVFEELGITKAQLDNVTNADQLLVLLANTLGQVEDRAKQVSLARALGIEELLPVLRLGADEVARLRDEASELGLVMGREVVAELDKADREMERAGQQFRIIKDTALAPLATGFAELTADIAASSVEISQMTGQLPTWQRALAQFAQFVPGVGGMVRKVASSASAALEVEFDEDDPALLRQRMAVANSQKPGGFDLKGNSLGKASASSAAKQAEREAEQRRQRADRAQQQIERADDAIAKSYGKGLMSIDDRARYEVADLEVERAARLREIKRGEEEYIRSKGLSGLTKAEADLLRTKQDELTEQKKSSIEWERRRENAARRLEVEGAAAEAAIEFLDIEAELARTHGERSRIEREILLATIELARKRKKAALDDDPELGEDERADAMRVFDRNARGRIEVFDDRESERLKQQFKGYGREVVAAIEQGRVGEYIGDKIKERLIDGALDQLFEMFKMSKGEGGGGGWLKTAFDFVAGGFKSGGGRASGGGVEKGKFYTTVEHGRPELMMIGGNGHVTSAAETVRLLQESLSQQSASGGAGDSIKIDVPVNIHAPGADAAGLARVEAEVRRLRSDLPSIAVKSVAEAKQRRLAQ